MENIEETPLEVNTTSFNETTHHKFSAPLLYCGEAFTVVFMVFGIVGNILTILAILCSQRLKNPASTYIISLSLADLFFCSFNLPFSISLFLYGRWVHGDLFCILTPFFRYANVGISLLTITALTINRYVLIVHRSKYDRIYTKQCTLLSVLFLWLFSYIILIPTLIEKWGKFGYDPSILSCSILTKNRKSPKTFLFTLGFLLPCIVIVFCYASILKVVKTSRQKLETHRIEENAQNVLPKPKKTDWRLTRMILIIFLTFLICYLPVTLVKIFDKKGRFPELQMLSNLLIFMSASINPLIYALSNRAYRQAFKDVIMCRCLTLLKGKTHSTDRLDTSASASKSLEMSRIITQGVKGNQVPEINHMVTRF